MVNEKSPVRSFGEKKVQAISLDLDSLSNMEVGASSFRWEGIFRLTIVRENLVLQLM